MAGQPITSKPVLTDVALNDVIYIVDVSDTSESAQGTSKITTVENVLGAIEGGTYTPTVSDITDDATVDVSAAWWYRTSATTARAVILMDVQMDGANNSTTFNVSTPIASNFASARQATAQCNNRPELESIFVSSGDPSKFYFEVGSVNNGDPIQSISIGIDFLIV